jgi:amidophosphoribosyltransferase
VECDYDTEKKEMFLLEPEIDYIWNNEKLKEECGVFGIFDNDGHDCARLTYYGLFSLQHRGQESCGIAVNNNMVFSYHKDMGLVNEVFKDEKIDELKGSIAVGHVRYSTTGSSERQNAQPLVSKYIKGTLAIAHNGNIVNSKKIKDELEKNGAIFQTSADSEVIMFLIARERIKCGSVEEAIKRSMAHIIGAYSLIVMSAKKLIGVRDPLGFRPLCIGKLDNSYILASESCALDSVGATFIRDVEPGEIVVIEKNGIRSIKDNCTGNSRMCIFEFIYFARSDSVIEGESVHETRKQAGRILARENPVDADIVIGVPDSAIDAALGYAEESGIPYGIGFTKNRYIGRTFIQPDQKQREIALKIKLNALKSSVNGKRVIMVDDSIVRGTTCNRIVKTLKDAGATEVHVRISSPPFRWPCYFGTDIPSSDQLTAYNHTIEEIRQIIGADSLGYLSTNGLKQIVKNENLGFCDACFSGIYPVNTKIKEI